MEWWQDWERFKLLPGGGSEIATEPHIVYQVLSLCENTKTEIERKNQERQRAEIEAARKKAEAKRHGGRN